MRGHRYTLFAHLTNPAAHAPLGSDSKREGSDQRTPVRTSERDARSNTRARELARTSGALGHRRVSHRGR